MSDAPKIADTLADLHILSWDMIEGAYVKVKQEVTETSELSLQPKTETVVREGTIVGRANGTTLYYDSKTGENIPDNECGIYLETPEDTILEVRTDKLNNELLEFEHNE